MEDTKIIDLYFARDQEAIAQTDKKYGPYCYRIAYNVLGNVQDAEESVSDTYLAAWNRIPPTRPEKLGSFLGKIARYISIDRWRSDRTKKRGGDAVALALEELGECIGGGTEPERAMEQKCIVKALNVFLARLSQEERNVFLRRYWFLDSSLTIAQRYACSESRITSMLFRTRKKLRKYFQQEGLL